MSLGISIAVGVLVVVLTLVSYVQRLYTEMGKFLSREFQENVEAYEQLVEPAIGLSRQRLMLSFALLEQFTAAAIAVLIAYNVFHEGHREAAEIAQAVVLLVLIIVIFNRLIPFVFFTRTRGEWIYPLRWPLRLLVYLVFPVTVILGFCLQVAALAEEHEPEEPEHPSEAVGALMDAAQEEGILEESDRELIQSVVEFGDTTVREVMTPRPEIFAVAQETTIEDFKKRIRENPYSRVPIYGSSLDDIKGMVLAHDVLQVPDVDARTRTVHDLMRPVEFVPETQRVSSLLKQMQRENAHLAIVADEYGGVAGVVTIEDMLEEIVGEIRDEHEEKTDIVRESADSYIVPGTLDVYRLQELFGTSPSEHEATSVAGLVSEILGRIPKSGEVVDDDGLRFEVLHSTDRRVERLRVKRLQRVAAPKAESA